MGRRELDGVESKLRKRQRQFPELKIERIDDAIRLNGVGKIACEPDRNERAYVVTFEPWHGHFATADEAIEVAIEALAGTVRFAQEFRGSTTSATWRERWDGSAYEVWNLAYFLNPMDRSEWQLWSGETWRVQRTHHRLIGTDAAKIGKDVPELGQSLTSETVQEQPFIVLSNGPLDWLERSYGAPEAGMHWTVAGFKGLVFQLPDGWRRFPEKDDKYVDYVAEGSDCLVRVGTFFRNRTEAAPPKADGAGIAPHSIESRDENDIAPGFSAHVWDVIFEVGQYDALAQVYLYEPEGTSEETRELRERLDRSVRACRYAP